MHADPNFFDGYAYLNWDAVNSRPTVSRVLMKRCVYIVGAHTIGRVRVRALGFRLTDVYTKQYTDKVQRVALSWSRV